MSVLDNMLLAGSAQPGERLWRVFAAPRSVRRRERELRSEAMELLRFVRLDAHADAYAGKVEYLEMLVLNASTSIRAFTGEVSSRSMCRPGPKVTTSIDTFSPSSL